MPCERGGREAVRPREEEEGGREGDHGAQRAPGGGGAAQHPHGPGQERPGEHVERRQNREDVAPLADVDRDVEEQPGTDPGEEEAARRREVHVALGPQPVEERPEREAREDDREREEAPAEGVHGEAKVVRERGEPLRRHRVGGLHRVALLRERGEVGLEALREHRRRDEPDERAAHDERRGEGTDSRRARPDEPEPERAEEQEEVLAESGEEAEGERHEERAERRSGPYRPEEARERHREEREHRVGVGDLAVGPDERVRGVPGRDEERCPGPAEPPRHQEDRERPKRAREDRDRDERGVAVAEDAAERRRGRHVEQVARRLRPLVGEVEVHVEALLEGACVEDGVPGPEHVRDEGQAARQDEREEPRRHHDGARERDPHPAMVAGAGSRRRRSCRPKAAAKSVKPAASAA